MTNNLLRKTLEDRKWDPDVDVQLNRGRTKPNFQHFYTCRVCEMMHKVRENGNYQFAMFCGNLNSIFFKEAWLLLVVHR